MSFEAYFASLFESIQVLPEGPLFNNLHINPTELCNRSCSFCPRGVDYPNKNLHITTEVIDKLVTDLDELDFKGKVDICGNGEPLLSKNLTPLVERLRQYTISLTTNGDTLTVEKIKELVETGVDYFIISMYDGEHQIKEFTEKFSECGVRAGRYSLRSYWTTGEYFTNRAGSLKQITPIHTENPCNMLHYQMDVTVDGSVEFCCHTAWKNDFYHGNILESSLKEIWYGKRMTRYRRLLEQGRAHKPCRDCNVGGTRYGNNFVEKWQEGVGALKE